MIYLTDVVMNKLAPYKNLQATTGSSLVLLFDELTRNSRVLREGGSEEQFFQFAVSEPLINF